MGSDVLITNWLWFLVGAVLWRMAIKLPVNVSFPFLPLFLHVDALELIISYRRLSKLSPAWLSLANTKRESRFFAELCRADRSSAVVSAPRGAAQEDSKGT